MVKDSGGFVKSKAKGTVNFPPFESLDDHSMREIKRYQIYPWGKIQEYCRHIPYNSGKKDFYEKTGRESFEGQYLLPLTIREDIPFVLDSMLTRYLHAVFQYVFKVPGDDNEYTVMWDYNVGLVRMTPFFKCCKYSKTQPAKMLNLNPGLRDITHSITGGSIMAQGYWMPFTCAKAVCATFCAPVAGALIPIFGPDFPSQCTSPDAPEHGRMQIDQMIIVESAREAEMFRRMFANAASTAVNSHLPLPHLHHHQQQQQQQQQHHHSQIHHYSHGPALPSPTSIPSPRLGRRALPRYSGSPHDYERERLSFEGRTRFKRAPDSPYMADSEPDMHGGPELHHILATGGMMYSPLSPPRSSGSGSGWTVANHPHQQPHHIQAPSLASVYHPIAYRETHELPFPSSSDPVLSAIPRFGHGNPRLEHQHHQQHHQYQPHPAPHFPPRLPPISVSSNWSSPHRASSSKRPAAGVLEVAGDYEECSDKSSPTTTVTTNTSLSREDCAVESTAPAATAAAAAAAASGTDKNAALLLMHLSVRDHKDVREVRDGQREDCGGGRDGHHGVRGCGPESMSMSPVSGPGGQDGHRSKRRRATSM
ncbi:unnamed protein product [Discula destructiva]